MRRRTAAALRRTTGGAGFAMAATGLVGVAGACWRRSQRAQQEAAGLAQAERELAETTERYRSLFDYHSQSTFSLDLEGRFVDVNRVAEQVSGYTREQLCGTSFLEVLHPDDGDRALVAFAAALDRQAVQQDLRLVDVSGRVVELAVTSIPVVVSDEVVGVHGIAEDVTERNRLQRDLVRSEQAAVRANAAKSVFVANVSHEIRTPLTSMLAVTELLADAGLDEDGRRFVQILDRSGRRLIRLVDDLLDFARIEAGVIAVDDTDLDLGALVEDALAMASVAAADKGLDLVAEVDPELPQKLRGDAHRISQVLANLVGNAVKFTPSGSVRVSAEVAEQRDGVVVVLIRVTDTGIGMTSEEQERVFEPFSQADPSITRAYGGTGLGLAICKHLVQLMEGSIWATSAPRQGTTLSLLLPLRPA